jgi:hypothetical protein
MGNSQVDFAGNSEIDKRHVGVYPTAAPAAWWRSRVPYHRTK